MLTWAMVYYCTKTGGYNGLWFVIAMGCDVGIFYYLSEAAKACARCPVTG